MAVVSHQDGPLRPSDLPGEPRLLQLLSEAAAQLLAAEDPRTAVTALFDLIAGDLRLDVYFNYLLQDDGLVLASSRGLSEEMAAQGACLQLGSAVCGMVAASRAPHHARDVQASDDPQLAFIRQAGLDCYACTPMVVGDRLLGTLGFGRRWAPCFSNEELQFLRTVTHYVAMAYERLRTEAALRESERRLNAVLDNASVAIILMDERQHCAYMNAAAERLTGYSFAETRGRPLHDVVHHTRPDGSPFPIEECAIDRAFPENNNQQGEEVFVHKDGSFYPVAFTASPIRDDASRTVGTIIEVRDISQQKRTEEARELLMREVDHRARNALAVVQSVLQLTSSEDVGAYKETVLGRVSALARAQGSLAAQGWEGGSLRDVLVDELETLARSGQYELSGPDVTLAPGQVQPIGMLVHELATNAAKYGGLSTAAGKVSVSWEAQDGRLTLVWRESGGPPVVEPTRRGFGSRLIANLARQLGGEVEKQWRPEGVVATLRLG